MARSTRSAILGIPFMLITAATAFGSEDQTIFSAPPPERMTAGRTQATKSVPSLSTGAAPDVTIPLDNTGISDWSYMNPRRPSVIKRGSGIEFHNRTVDRKFEISTSVSLSRADLALLRDPMAGTFPSDAPSLVLEAVRLLNEATNTPGYQGAKTRSLNSPSDVQSLTAAIATAHRQETEARERYERVAVNSASPAAEIVAAEAALRAAIQARAQAEQQLTAEMTVRAAYGDGAAARALLNVNEVEQLIREVTDRRTAETAIRKMYEEVAANAMSQPQDIAVAETALVVATVARKKAERPRRQGGSRPDRPRDSDRGSHGTGNTTPPGRQTAGPEK